ncbi:hypothetical protein AB9F26_06285 [Falsihalocynthiibacter sp. BN13B15]|uniref:hypothetical protein n=1 Tax=Falsihalocynthiibacter sp. BN13B15 TaxID=3240871 RepID=UPI00350F38BB
MTRGRGKAARGIAAILSRLSLVLAVALFGAHHVGAKRTATHNGPVEALETAFAPVILTAQSHLIRAPLPEGDTPQATAPAPKVPKQRLTLARVSWQYVASVSTPAITILPPVRGPPAV